MTPCGSNWWKRSPTIVSPAASTASRQRRAQARRRRSSPACRRAAVPLAQQMDSVHQSSPQGQGPVSSGARTPDMTPATPAKGNAPLPLAREEGQPSTTSDRLRIAGNDRSCTTQTPDYCTRSGVFRHNFKLAMLPRACAPTARHATFDAVPDVRLPMTARRHRRRPRQRDPRARDGRRRGREVRPSGHADGHGRDRRRAVARPPAPQPGEPDVARPRPLRAVATATARCCSTRCCTSPATTCRSTS